MPTARANVVSSFTIIKGALIAETYRVFELWDFDLSRFENLRRIKEENLLGAASANWLRDVAKVINRRFDPGGRDKPLVALAKAGCPRSTWKPLLLWHMTQDEYLLRDFLLHWLYARFKEGRTILRAADVTPYLQSLPTKGVSWAGSWTDATTARVAAALLRIAADFDLVSGAAVKRFAAYRLPDDSFLYLLHAITQSQPNAQRLIEVEDWHMYLMNASDVEHELLRLHQYKKLNYEVAGTLAQLRLPHASLCEHARSMQA
jgi:Putative inner membrane protein (DUF1819)